MSNTNPTTIELGDADRASLDEVVNLVKKAQDDYSIAKARMDLNALELCRKHEVSPQDYYPAIKEGVWHLRRNENE